MIRILIVEDEFIIGQHIRSTLEGFGYAVVGQAMDASSALTMFQDERPDLVILDITLSDQGSGITFAKEINQTAPRPIIYLTSHSDPQTISQAMATKPAAYLTKPFKKADLYAAIELAIYNFAEGIEPVLEPSAPPPESERRPAVIADAVFVKHNRMLVKVSFASITYLKSDRVYLELHRNQERPLLLRDSLRNFEAKLTDRFLRIHRSYIINLDHLDSIGNDSVKVGGKELPLGKPYRQELLSRIQS